MARACLSVHPHRPWARCQAARLSCPWHETMGPPKVTGFHECWTVPACAEYIQSAPSAHPEDPPFRVSTWKKANPSPMGGHFPWLKERIALESQGSKKRPVICCRVISFFEAEPWDRATISWQGYPPGFSMLGPHRGRARSPKASVIGAWISAGTPQAPARSAAWWPESGRLQCCICLPCNEPTLQQRGATDGVGNLYARGSAKRASYINSGGTSTLTTRKVWQRRHLRSWGSRAPSLADQMENGGFRMMPCELRVA